ncbi:site-specific recombinase, phage integrase family [Pseudomonas sp. R4-34-07]|uniref:hypothetical protein n=1 Tax=Pseudomonas sp. R4-34-07 TaxID=658642 RepID=UPI000F720C2E|nr:site-specific recombinase, phage integrase family [Pseudomonas sp. R4-34-07]
MSNDLWCNSVDGCTNERLAQLLQAQLVILDIAKAEWAKLDCKPVPKKNALLGLVFDRYEREIIPGKAPKTQSDTPSTCH